MAATVAADDCADNYNWKIQDLNKTASIEPNSFEYADVTLVETCLDHLVKNVMGSWDILAIYDGKVDGVNYGGKITKVKNEDHTFYLDGKAPECQQELLFEKKAAVSEDPILEEAVEEFLFGLPIMTEEFFDEVIIELDLEEQFPEEDLWLA